MEDKLKNLRKDMDGTVLKKGEVSEREKERIYYTVIHSRSSKRKPRRLVPALSFVTCLLLVFILGSNGVANYFGTEQGLEKEEQEQPDLSVGDDEVEKKMENEQAEFDKRKFPDEHYQKIYDYLLKWELPEENRISLEDSEIPSNIEYENGYSFSKDTGYISSINWGQRDPEVDDQPLPTEDQYMGVVMGYINEKAADIEVELLSPPVVGVYNNEVDFRWVVNVDGIKEIHDRSALVRDRMELAMNYSDELPALKSEIDKIYTKADTLANDSASLEDDSIEKAREIEQQYVVLKQSIVNLAGIIDLARKDKLNEQSY
ncbi:hypothetical protein [Pseudalkalibacillus sp. NRS-1564]|uniref:hypothetical protein n=1 Tax=Pseudalkalibacillus sp. NRS-1564 TaxID=3233900 RepID=UPI003D294EE9